MGPVVVAGGVAAMALFVIGFRTERHPRAGRARNLDRRRALPWMAGAVILVISLVAATSTTGPIVMLGLVPYAAFAAFAVWRMAVLDRASIWLPPSRRQARLAVSLIGLTWLGVVLGLLLWIADLVASYTLRA
jgi:hypothetical protein